ncbi:alpha/beta hydrolase [Rhodococcus rhodnii]|nr:alpha/beta hydrolase [Rhodococcus rhodnii]TXG92002.1 alpha/beta hydrolase [Rhodococcus rhodnii]
MIQGRARNVTERRALAGALGIGAGIGALALGGAMIARGRKGEEILRAADVGTARLFDAPDAEPDVLEIDTPDGARLHVRAWGPRDAEPLVLSHGWTCSIEYWYPQINAFAENYRVIAYDQRGHGRSTLGASVLSPQLLADDLAAVLAETVDPSSKAVLVGHSMGGMSIISFAERHPDLVDRYVHAVLLASTATDSLVADSALIPLPPRFPRIPQPVGRAIIGSTIPFGSAPFAARAVKYVALSPTATREQVEFCRSIVTACHPRARGGWGTALSALDVREGLHNLSVPTSVVVGTRDRLTPQTHARRLAATLDEARHLDDLIVLDGVGHMSTVEAPDAVNEEILRLRKR